MLKLLLQTKEVQQNYENQVDLIRIQNTKVFKITVEVKKGGELFQKINKVDNFLKSLNSEV